MRATLIILGASRHHFHRSRQDVGRHACETARLSQMKVAPSPQSETMLRISFAE